MGQKGIASLMLLVIALSALVPILAGAAYFYSKKTTPANPTVLQNEVASPSPSQSTSPSPSTQPKTKSEFEIKLPQGVELSERNFEVSVETVDEIRKRYGEITSGELGCSGPCSEFMKNPDLLEKQFKILSDASTTKDCILSNNLKNDVTKDFWLFASAGEARESIEGIYNPNLGICGIKYLGSDGYDVDIYNLRYKAGFVKDNKVIRIDFTLVPTGIFKEVDQMVSQIGHTADGYCDESCAKKELDYFENYNDYPETKIVTKAYDESVKTLKLN